MDPRWLNILGLVVTMAGATVLAGGLILSKTQALRVGVSRVAESTDEANVNLPHVRNKLRESRFALIGAIFLVVGFLLQIAANWPR